MSSLAIGIVGLPNVGKSTLFNAVTNNQVTAANYPFATIDPNVGVVEVADERLEGLAALHPQSPVVRSTVTFTDIAGLVAGASEGEGLGNQFLANIREVAAIAHVVRAFSDDNVSHVGGGANPERDIDTITTELVLADIQTLSKRAEAMDKPARNDAQAKRDLEATKQLLTWLDAGQTLQKQLHPEGLEGFIERTQVSEEMAALLRQLLTVKPVVYVFNVDEDGLNDRAHQHQLAELVAPAEAVFVCARLEAELAGLEAAERAELLGEFQQEQSGLSRLTQASYRALGLISFFTVGEKEVRAWPIPEGSRAPEAAGTIHSDFQRGFIAAEIINWSDLVSAGSKSAARAQGLLRTEGKDYTMRDGDVAEFRFNV